MPKGVSDTPFGVRLKIVRPISVSKFLMDVDNTLWETKRFAAARLMDPAFAASTMYFN